MVKLKKVFFAALILFFLIFSFYPTILELRLGANLIDKNREFLLEHNYYWPDYNLYLSKIKQAEENRLSVVEKYTNEPHKGSLIQVFYLYLGYAGEKVFGLDANNSYLLGRIVLSPILLVVVALLCRFFFRNFLWQSIAFLITVTSGSYIKLMTGANGTAVYGRYMEWWSNIDALQRMSFIPHILFGQVVSFFLLYKLTLNKPRGTIINILILSILGNVVGIVFPPSLITLNATLILLLFLRILSIKHFSFIFEATRPPNQHTLILETGDAREGIPNSAQSFSTRRALSWDTRAAGPVNSDALMLEMIDARLISFLVFTLPSFLYFLIITKFEPWASLVEFHRTHPMMIPFWEYILGIGPILLFAFCGTMLAIIKRKTSIRPLIFWTIVTFLFAILFTHVKEQSPLRFTQTGLFIPLGILGTYFFYRISRLGNKSKIVTIVFIALFLMHNLFVMNLSLKWQIAFITQRVKATIPAVPYPPQTMYPLREWMDGIRWLRDYTNHKDVVIAALTAANYIPAYAGNFVYFGQSNTVNYDFKQAEMETLFAYKKTPLEAQIFLRNARIRYVFYSTQEREMGNGKNISTLYPFLKPVYTNPTVTIYEVSR